MRLRDLLTPTATRQRDEQRAPEHPRQELDPFAELEVADAQVEMAGVDEEMTMFDPDTHPKAHTRDDPDEPVCDDCGELFDLMTDTGPIDDLTLGSDPGATGDLMIDSPAVEDELGGFEF